MVLAKRINVLFIVTTIWTEAMVTINETSTCEDVSKSGECDCSSGLNSLYVKCNISNSIFRGRFSGNESATIECSARPVMNGLLRIGTRTSVILRNCLDYLKPTTLRQLLDMFGSSKEESIEIKFDNYTEIDLPRTYFLGFGALKMLRLHFHIKHLRSDVLGELTMLEQFSLRGGYEKLPSDLLTNQINLLELVLTGNRIEEIPEDFFSHQNKLMHLDISINLLDYINENAFANLTSLIHLDLSNNRLQAIHENAFQSMTKLEYFSLKSNKLAFIPTALLRGLTVLANLDLSENQLRVLPPDLLRNHTQLFRSDLSQNEIGALPATLFETNGALQYVNISHNSLVTLPSKLFHTLQKLISLDLSNNQLSTLDSDTFNRSPYVIFLYLQSNRLCFAGSLYRNEHDQDESSFSPFWPIRTQLRELNLSNNSIDRVDIAWVRSPKLKKLDLSYNKLSKFDNEDFKFQSNEMVVDLEFNQIATLSLIETDATKGSDGFILFKLNNNPINCDCRVSSFVMFLQKTGNFYRRWRFTVDHLRCIQPELNRNIKLVNVVMKNLLCERYDDCPEACRCYVLWSNETVLVNCDNQNLNKLPNLMQIGKAFDHVELFVTNNSLESLTLEDSLGYEKVKKFNASFNRIQNLISYHLPNVETLDLSNNNIISLLQLSHLINYSSQLTSIRLSFNPWLCDCDSTDPTRIIQNSSDRIEDFKTIRCSDGRELNLLTISDLCSMDVITTVVIGLCFCVIFCLIASFIVYAYQLEIKIWFFTNNLCMGLVSEQEVDKDKLYDAFLSYCHQDEEFVSATLIPRLETAPMNLKVCWHIRDWNPGEMITTQITHSIENSRRTIVVLSKDFLESSWGQLEFRTAHINSMAEKRIRLIIIIYGDLDDEERIDSEMKAYLKTNTYIKWGDPWFWQKLRYSMPHPPRVKGVRWYRTRNRVDIGDSVGIS